MSITYLGQIEEKLSTIALNKNLFDKNNEPVISKFIFNHLKKSGLKVTNEKQVGFLKFYIDIDYRDGKAGVEIKLAEKLVNDTGNTGEIQRLLGQIYYYTKNYVFHIIPVVMLLVIGDRSLENDPKILEIKRYTEKLGAQFKYLAFQD